MRPLARRFRHARTASMTTTALTATALALLVAAPALAHPYVVGGGRVPVQSLATIELDLAHGCGVEAAGTGPATDEVALEVPEWLRIVDVPGRDGWSVTIEDATDARLGVVVWTATSAAEPAPRLLLDVVVDAEAGETRYLRVSQRCGARVERWIGTPDEPAEQPAVRLRLDPPDPERPAPPLPDREPASGPQPEPEPEQEPGVAPEPTVTLEATSEQPEEDPTSNRTAAIAAIAALGGALVVRAAVLAVRRRRPD